MSRIGKYFAFTMLVLFYTVSILHADLTKTEEQEINNYRLSKPKIAQFWQATKNLIAAAQNDPTLFDQRIAKKESNTLADVVEATNSLPAAKKAIEDAGMTAKEYWTFQMALLYAASGHMAVKAGGSLPQGFSKENAEFYGANEAEFMKMDKDLKELQKMQESSKDAEETTDESAEEED